MKIVPAILTADPADLERKIRQAETFADLAQIDIMDGEFVFSRSITAADLARIKTSLHLEIHLMVREPQGYLEAFQRAGASKIVFHYEATAAPQLVISAARSLGLGVGLAINPETPLSQLSPFLEQVDSLLLLAVDPGFYGSPFHPEVLQKIPQAKGLAPELALGIDGGVKADNIRSIALTGVDYIYVGSAIFREIDPKRSYQKLVALAAVEA